MTLLRILLLEDSLLDTELIQVQLIEGGINGELVRVETRTDFQAALENQQFDLILSDYSLPSFDGISALELAQANCPDIPFIFVSATLGEELAIETLKNGATDYVLKQRLERLIPSVKRALRETKERTKRQQAESELRKLAADLERRVVKRTSQLAEVNQSLTEQIIERQRIEESLRQSESTLRSYFELPLIGIAISSPQKGWLEVNDKLCDIFGYERDELLKMTWVELTYPDDLDADLVYFNQLLAGNSDSYTLEKRFIRKNGEVIYTSISVRCVRRQDQSINYFVAIVQDITERKQAEIEREQLIAEQAARREAEEQKRKAQFLAEASTELSTSLDYETTLANVAKLVVPFIADWCIVDILDNNQVIQRVAMAHLESSKEELAQMLNQRYPENLNQDGKLVRVLLSGQPEVITEITDTHLIEAAQDAEHLQMLRQLGLKSAIIVPLMTQGKILGAMTFVIAESERHYTTTDLPFVEDLAHRAALAVDNALLHHQTQEARQIAEQAYAAEREARADSEAARTTAEAANRIKDEFLATLSHELRTPLNAMLGWTQLLRTRKMDEVKIAKALETIDRNTKSLAALIEDILDVSRIMTGKFQLSTHACELMPVIEAAIEAVRPAAEAKMIEIKFLPKPSPGLVWGDINRLQQVVWNLLSNAIKFTPKGGRVEVKLSKVKSHLPNPPNPMQGRGWNEQQTTDNNVQIQITDTGKGISSEFLPYVFERFRQENSSSTRAHGGLGLGLAIVRYLVELHGGTVKAQSPGEGLGATFTVQLPLFVGTQELKVGSRELLNDSSGLLPTLEGLQVLIVDDEADARELLITILEQNGAQVKAAASVNEAFALLLESRVEVLVSDIAMPHVDGYAFIRQVRALEEQGEQIPAVALSAYARDVDRELALEAGFQVHLAKPFDANELVRVVAKLAGYSQVLSAGSEAGR